MAACGPQPPAPQAPAQQGQPAATNLAQNQEFRFSLTGEPPGLDPQYTSWDPAIAVLVSLFDSLLGFDENFKLVPAVAREVPTLENGGISLDLKTYTYRLRTDVQHGFYFVLMEEPVHRVIRLEITVHDRHVTVRRRLKESTRWHVIALEHDNARAHGVEELDERRPKQSKPAGHEHVSVMPKLAALRCDERGRSCGRCCE
jgi:hypothetical protein